MAESIKFKKLKMKQPKSLKSRSSQQQQTQQLLAGESIASARPNNLLSSIQLLTSPAGDVISGAEFTAKDHLLSSILYGVRVCSMSRQDPLPPFLLSDHFKSSVKYSMKSASSNPAVFAPSLSYEMRLSSILAATTAMEEDPLLAANVTSSKQDSSLSVALSLPNWLKVKEYAPNVFGTMRDKVYSFSRCFDSFFDAERGPPLSCSRSSLYVTSDRQVLVKSIEGSDVESLLSLLKTLHPHLVNRKSINSHSLLPQYLACFRIAHASLTGPSESSGAKVSSSDSSHVYLVLIRNPLSGNESFFPIHSEFVVTAETVVCVSRRRGVASQTDDLQMTLKSSDGRRLMSALEADLKFLAAHLLVGYSLVIGVHSIDEWERQLTNQERGEGDDVDDVTTSAGHTDSLISSVTRSLGQGMRVTGDDDDIMRKDSLSLVIDPVKHPFALPSPFVGVDSRASSRPSSLNLAAESETSTGGGGGGRFVYFVGFDDLLPLSASFSSKELNLDNKSSKKSSLLESSSSSASDVTKNKEEMGKKEAAREYSRNMLNQVKKRIVMIEDEDPEDDESAQ
jgi:hypothetical protein